MHADRRGQAGSEKNRQGHREGRAAILGGWFAVRLWCGCNEEKQARKNSCRASANGCRRAAILGQPAI